MVGTRLITRASILAGARPSRSSLTVWTTRTYILYICARCCQDRFGELRILLGEGWNWTIGEAEGVMAHQNLAITVRSGTDSNRRNLEACGNARGQVLRYRLQNNCEHAGLLQHFGIL